MGKINTMAPKKKGGKKKKKASGVDKPPDPNAADEMKVEIPKDPEHGYVNLCLRLSHAPMPKYCFFHVHMLTTSRLMMVKDQIVEYQGASKIFGYLTRSRRHQKVL